MCYSSNRYLEYLDNRLSGGKDHLKRRGSFPPDTPQSPWLLHGCRWFDRLIITVIVFLLVITPVGAAPVLSESSMDLVARAVAAECGDAPYSVQIALAAVVVNRMEDGRFGDTAAAVVWGADFLVCTRTGRIAVPIEPGVYDMAYAAVRCASEGFDPTGGALWYGGGSTGRLCSRVRFGEAGYLFW